MNEIKNTSVYIPEVVKEYHFNLREKVMAFAALVAGFLAVKLAIAPLITEQKMGLGAACALIFIIVLGMIYPSSQKNLTPSKALRIALCLMFSANIFLSANYLIQSLDLIFAVMIIIYDKFADSDEKFAHIRKMLPVDIFRAAFMPINEYEACHKAVKSSISEKKLGKNITHALAGFAIAIPSTLVVGFLLIFADEGFENIMEDFFLNGEIISDSMIFAVQFLFSLPISYYIFSLFRNSEKRLMSYDDERCIEGVCSLRFLPSATAFFSAVPVCVLYVVFFFSQLSYFISSFTSKLPADITSYSDYARRGFFELCIVALINLAIIIAINLFSKYNDDGKRPLILRIITCVLSVFTVMLIITAVSKMVMYINVYGLTPLRVYTTWFMLLLSVIFVGIFIAMITSRLNLSKLIVTAFTVMFSALSFCNVDGMIADYNAQSYLNGKLPEFDVSIMYELSPSAVPSVIQLRGKLDGTDNAELEAIISSAADNTAENDLRTLTLYDFLNSEYSQNK